MASVLNSNAFFFLEELDDDDIEIQNEYEGDEKASIWLKSTTGIIRPSTNLIMSNKLEPGTYKVDVNREYGQFCTKVNQTTDELYLFSDSIISSLLEEIKNFWLKSKIYKENNLTHKRGILLEGFPGTGKSSIINLLEEQLIVNGGVVFHVNSPRDLSTHIDFMRHSFREIQPDTPVITVLEDIDKYIEHEHILSFLDGQASINHHVLIATTNNTEEIPDTFLRPSRIDMRIEVPNPTDEIRKEYFLKKKVPEDILDELVEKSKDFSFADLKELYISVILLESEIDEAVLKIASPRDKKNYTNKKLNTKKLGI